MDLEADAYFRSETLARQQKKRLRDDVDSARNVDEEAQTLKRKEARKEAAAKADLKDEEEAAAMRAEWIHTKTQQYSDQSQEDLAEALYKLTAEVKDKHQLMNAFDLALLRHPILDAGTRNLLSLRMMQQQSAIFIGRYKDKSRVFVDDESLQNLFSRDDTAKEKREKYDLWQQGHSNAVNGGKNLIGMMEFFYMRNANKTIETVENL